MLRKRKHISDVRLFVSPIPSRRKGIMLWRGPYARPIKEQNPYENPMDIPTLARPSRDKYPWYLNGF